MKITLTQTEIASLISRASLRDRGARKTVLFAIVVEAAQLFAEGKSVSLGAIPLLQAAYLSAAWREGEAFVAALLLQPPALITLWAGKDFEKDMSQTETIDFAAEGWHGLPIHIRPRANNVGLLFTPAYVRTSFILAITSCLKLQGGRQSLDVHAPAQS